MQVEVITRSEALIEEMDWRDAVTIKVDGEKVFHVCDDEPEDSNLSRSFNDCYDVHNLMRMAWRAGKDGKPFDMEIREAQDV